MPIQYGAEYDAGPGATPLPSTRRRTLVRTAAHAAWATPALVAATAAPAFAASDALTITFAAFFWRDNLSRTPPLYGFAPLVRVRNDGRAPATDLRVTIAFTPDFEGLNGQPGSVRTPALIRSLEPDWVYFSHVLDTRRINGIYARASTAPALAPGAELTLGIWTPSLTPHRLAWASKPDVQTVGLTVTATGFTPATGVLTRVPTPT